MTKVLVIGGTSDARELILEILELNMEVIATVTTPFGAELLKERKGLTVLTGKLDAFHMENLIRDSGSKCVVDASHPYAAYVSENTIAAAKGAEVPYIRYERPGSDNGDLDVLRVLSFEEAAEKVKHMKGNLFLTIGSNHIPLFVTRISDYRERLFVRVLPDSKVIGKCEELGLTAGNIFAAKGPFSERMNMEMLKHCNAKVLVTKDSGDTGGTMEKISAAKKLGVKVVLVHRPDVEYSNLAGSFEEVIDFLRKYC
ncbi:MAG: precorrin-6A reductase [Clostridia bacterium]|nr:precorrin-6A reductase [Clostridia bacterium]